MLTLEEETRLNALPINYSDIPELDDEYFPRRRCVALVGREYIAHAAKKPLNQLAGTI